MKPKVPRNKRPVLFTSFISLRFKKTINSINIKPQILLKNTKLVAAIFPESILANIPIKAKNIVEQNIKSEPLYFL